MQIVMSLLSLASIISCFIIGEVSAFTHIVGGSHGWRVPDYLTYFEEWAKPRTFGVGDKLVFPSRPMGNNVVMVSKEDFGPCTQNKVLNMYYEGPTILNLTQTGDYYFYSGVGKHCEAGQKLHITVGQKEGSSGDLSPFKLFSAKDHGIAAATAANSDTSYQLPDDKYKSSATTIRNMGAGFVGLLATFLFLSLI